MPSLSSQPLTSQHKWKPHELCVCLVSEVQQGDMLVMSLNEAELPPALQGRVKLGHSVVSELAPAVRSVVPLPGPGHSELPWMSEGPRSGQL